MNYLPIIYAIITGVMSVFLCGLVISVAHNHKSYRGIIMADIILAICTMCTYALYVVAPEKWLAEITMLFYHIMVLGLNYITYTFIIKYTGAEKAMRIPSAIYMVAAGGSSISEVLNLKLHNLYSIEQITRNGASFWIKINTGWNWIHNGIVIAIVLTALILLLRKAIISPAFYRSIYAGLFTGLVIIFLVNAICILAGSPIDYSVLLYAMFAGMVNYLINYGVSRRLMSKILRMANYNINDGYIYYDSHGFRIYANLKAKQLFQTAGKEAKTAMEQYLADHLQEDDGEEEEQWEDKFVGAEERICDITYRKVFHSDMLLGGYLWLRDKTEEVREYENERFRATHDLLTGVYNRETFFTNADLRLQELKEGTLPSEGERDWVFLSINIVDFKLINELFGAKAGDSLLQLAAEQLKFYAHDTTVYGRIVDDRFAMLLEKKYFVPERFIEGASEVARQWKEGTFNLHFHMGIYEIEDFKEPATSMYDKTVLAIQTIEKDQQKYFAYYNPDNMDQLMEELNTVDDFDRALAEGVFPYFVQPQVKADGTLMGLNTVSYMKTRDGIVPIQKKIEQSGNVHRLDRYLWEEAFRAMKDMKAKGLDKFYICVKIRAKDLYYLNVVEVLTGLATQYGVETNRVHVEITENVLMLDRETNMSIINCLKEKGFYVVIDDFGNGYSSLNVLKDMSIDAIKMDADIFEGEDAGARGRVILTGLMDMTKELGIQVVLDWVTREKQVKLLKNYENAIYQGSYFIAPFAYAEFETKLEEKQWKVNRE